MEMLWRTGLVYTVIIVMAATRVAGGHRDEFAQSQGELQQIITFSHMLICVKMYFSTKRSRVRKHDGRLSHIYVSMQLIGPKALSLSVRPPNALSDERLEEMSSNFCQKKTCHPGLWHFSGQRSHDFTFMQFSWPIPVSTTVTSESMKN